MTSVPSHTEEQRGILAKNYYRIFVQIGRRDGFACNNCAATSPDLQIDHITPLSKGGLSQFDNLQLLCAACNRQKSNKMAIPDRIPLPKYRVGSAAAQVQYLDQQVVRGNDMHRIMRIAMLCLVLVVIILTLFIALHGQITPPLQ